MKEGVNRKVCMRGCGWEGVLGCVSFFCEWEGVQLRTYIKVLTRTREIHECKPISLGRGVPGPLYLPSSNSNKKSYTYVCV